MSAYSKRHAIFIKRIIKKLSLITNDYRTMTLATTDWSFLASPPPHPHHHHPPPTFSSHFPPLFFIFCVCVWRGWGWGVELGGAVDGTVLFYIRIKSYWTGSAYFVINNYFKVFIFSSATDMCRKSLDGLFSSNLARTALSFRLFTGQSFEISWCRTVSTV